MFLAGIWKYAVCIGGRNPISLSLEGSGEPIVWLMRHMAPYACIVLSGMKSSYLSCTVEIQVWRPHVFLMSMLFSFSYLGG